MVKRRGLTIGVLATVVIVVGGISWVVWRLWTNAGNIPPRVPWISVTVLFVVAGLVLWFGRTVRTYQKGRARKPLNPIRAARTLALAQAAALTGAAVLGWYAGQAAVLLPDADLSAYQHLFPTLGAGVVGGVVLLVAGMVVQSWCRVDPPKNERDRDDNGKGRPGAGNGR